MSGSEGHKGSTGEKTSNSERTEGGGGGRVGRGEILGLVVRERTRR